ncbi:MAG: DUF4864 domain-containing protein [Rhodoferax sp.]|nr:DUF4864 domain-containing protein [Rhodoferax sp.]
MRKLYSAMALWLVLAGLGFIPATAATKISAADTRAVQRVVQAQLDAFAADNADLAFSLAAPSIKQLFGNADNFLQMVRTGYPVVYRPASVSFLQPEPDAKEVVQPVHLTDGQGHAWLAVYRVQRQKDKSWRIAGCVVLAESGQSV